MICTRKNSGFTVVEVMISAALLALGLMALASLQVLGVRGNAGGDDRSGAAALLSGKLNEFMSLQYTQDPQTGEVTVDPRLLATDWTAPIKVNQSGLSESDIQTQFSQTTPDHEQFRYDLKWRIEDVGDQTRHGAQKLISLEVEWTDRLVQAAGAKERLSFSRIPLTPRYR